MLPFLESEYFNPSSLYEPAHGPAEAITEARKTVARLLGRARPAEILFTSCATESNNTAVFGSITANPDRRHIVTTGVEHPAIFSVGEDLQRRGLEVDFVQIGQRPADATHPGGLVALAAMALGREEGRVGLDDANLGRGVGIGSPIGCRRIHVASDRVRHDEVTTDKDGYRAGGLLFGVNVEIYRQLIQG